MKNKKQLCFIYLTLLINFISVSQNTFVPDDNFEQALIDLGYDAGVLDDFVPTANINTITNLDVASKSIADLTGVQDFVALSILDCSDNDLSSLTVSSNLNLTEIYCNNNVLTSLNVSTLPGLKILWCNNNQLTNLDVSNNDKVISIDCSYNQLTQLDVSKLLILNTLVCENNQITSINLSKNTVLSLLRCANNLLTNLDISNNTEIKHIECHGNTLFELNTNNNTILNFLFCAFNQLSSLDVSNNTALTELDCSYNQLCQLNIKNNNNNNILFINFSANLDLNCVVVDNASVTRVNWNPVAFSNYVNSQLDCDNFVPVDILENIVTNNLYVLPSLNNGHYYTASQGDGDLLNPGDTITTSQTIFIYNQTNCNSNETSFTVIITDDNYFIPKYFTPNQDGHHDYWKVQDFSNSIKNITIFNRHGKLLKSLNPSSLGWNGTFNGKPMETNDYWYIITLNSGETLKGHFTLKR